MQGKLAELEAMGISVYAASADNLEGAKEVAGGGIKFPIAYGVTGEDCALIGGWWNDDKGFIEPTEFILEKGGSVLGSMYASGAVGRMDPVEVVTFIEQRERRRKEHFGAR